MTAADTGRDAAPLLGLVLAGGRSARMRSDKAALLYGGRSQLERAMELIAPHVARAYVSVRADQDADPLRARFAQIRDTHENLGPVAGLLAAQAAHPHAAWLVLACDLPLLDEATLAYLVSSRAPQRAATAYRSSHDGLPEPLCAIWEPRSAAALAAYVAGGRQCPRRFLLSADTELLDEPNPRALDNINTPEEYRSAMTELLPEASAAPKRISVQYYALLREQAGRRDEALTTRARTPAELYAELARRYPFSLAPEMLRVAINAEFRDWTAALADGDAVVFIPPVAGG
ncbi:MAG: NTP transferase domain-containing protein [Gammaproteobacteria bacterium]|nr:NTP transferase domain-containing protein [Gammaproteobacteria bacterium]